MRTTIIFSVSIFFYSLLAVGQSIEKDFPKSFSIKVTNLLSAQREGVLVYISAEQLAKAAKTFNSHAFIVLDGQKEISSQYNDHDNDYKGIIFVLDKMNANESRVFTIRYNEHGTIQRNYTKRTQAELSHKVGGSFVNREYVGGEFKNVDFLRVPPEHKDHSWFIRYEGPGWESDKVAYRFYLDWRDATDVFGKTTHEMVLQNVGLDGFDSYHELQPWGMDVMKVGKSLGLGTLGTFSDGNAIRVDKTDSVNSRITENGVVFSSVLTDYYGWNVKETKMNVHSRLTIHAGTRLTHQFVTVSGTPENLCTGLVKDTIAKLVTSKGDALHYGYVASYGNQSLNKDNLGLAVFFKPSSFIGFTADEFSNVVKLKPDGHKLDYYFMAAWQLEPEGITDENQFMDYLNKTAIELSSPVKVELVVKK